MIIKLRKLDSKIGLLRNNKHIAEIFHYFYFLQMHLLFV